MQQSSVLKDWNGVTCVLATMHGKEAVISPLIETELGLEVQLPSGFNTDTFGTFTRDIRRAGNQLEAARKKALAAMKVTGLDIGLASEGSFGAHPSVPFIPSNLEIVVLIDSKNDIEIVGHCRTSSVRVQGKEITTPDEAVHTALSWGFPKQGVVLRLSEKSNRHMYKELTATEDLLATSQKLLSKWRVRSLFIETDMRAHRCPERMKSIETATADLIKNCKSLCPKCSTPGFVITDVVNGLQCGNCGLATDLVKETIYSCRKCEHSEIRPVADKQYAEPGECQWCNP